MSRAMTACGKAIFLTAFLLLFVWGIQNMQNTEILYTGWSLRYYGGIDDTSRLQAKADLIERSDESKGLWLSFWAECKAEFASEFMKAQADCTYFDSGARVKPEQFLAGDYPGELEKTGVAVSSELSWQLWGSLDTVGKDIRVDGEPKTVCGVYEGEKPAAIMKGGNDIVWQGAEVSSSEPVTREELIQLLTASPLGVADAMVDGSGITGLLYVLQYIPIFAAGVFVIIKLLAMRCVSYGRIIKRVAVLLALFAMGLLLPSLLSQLPLWLIPSRWSDLGFWSGLLETLWGYALEWFALKPAAKDIVLKQNMLMQGLYTIGMLFALIGIFRGERENAALQKGKSTNKLEISNLSFDRKL